MGTIETLVAIICGFITYMLLGFLFTEKKTKGKSNFRTFKLMVVAGVMLLSAEICTYYPYVYHEATATAVNTYEDNDESPYLTTFTYEVDGKDYECAYTSEKNDYAYKDGAQVKVLYNYTNPSKCIAIKITDSIFMMLFIEAFIGIALILTGFMGVVQNGVKNEGKK